MSKLSPRLLQPFLYGFLASALLVALYFGVLTLVSDFGYAIIQFSQFWYFIVTLSVGFGIQVGMYTYLRKTLSQLHGGNVLKVTGTTSTISMISCCSHYLVNLLPALGAVGFVTIIAQYQVELFWIGILFNLGGIAFIGNKIKSLT